MIFKDHKITIQVFAVFLVAELLLIVTQEESFRVRICIPTNSGKKKLKSLKIFKFLCRDCSMISRIWFL